LTAGDEEGAAAAMEVVRTGQGKRSMGRARSLADAMRGEEEQLLSRRSAAAGAALRQTVVTFSLATGLALALLGAVGLLQRRDASQRERSAEALRKSEEWLTTTLASILAPDASGREVLSFSASSKLSRQAYRVGGRHLLDKG